MPVLLLDVLRLLAVLCEDALLLLERDCSDNAALLSDCDPELLLWKLCALSVPVRELWLELFFAVLSELRVSELIDALDPVAELFVWSDSISESVDRLSSDGTDSVL